MKAFQLRESGPFSVVVPILVATIGLHCYAQSASPGSLNFDVASIKRSRPDERMEMETPPGRFRAAGVTLRFLTTLAYRVKDFQVSGGPQWVDVDRFDIEAKTENNPELNRFQEMLQSLLSDRFRLRLHRETEQMPAYALSVSRRSAKLVSAKADNCAPPSMAKTAGPAMQPCGTFRMIKRRQLIGRSVPLSLLAYTLSNVLQRTVIDMTNIEGQFDINLEWDADEARPGGDGSPLPPTLLSAVREQLGLELRDTIGPVEVIVIDHAEGPSAN